MSDSWKSIVRFFTSLELTVVLLVLSMVIVFVATLDQVNLGIWAVQEKYFRSFLVFWTVPNSQISLPIFPGGYLVGGLLIINLLAAHFYRFRLTWKKTGLILAHAGLVLLLVGEFVSGAFQEDYQVQLHQGETHNYAESMRGYEFVAIDVSNEDWDEVTAFPESLLSKGEAYQTPRLPFRVLIREYYENAVIVMRRDASNAGPSLATAGLGTQLVAIRQPITYKSDEVNTPVAFVEFVGPAGSLGTYLLSPQLGMEQQVKTPEGKTFVIAIRQARQYMPFSLTLQELRHDVYPGSDIPKNFSSRVRLRSEDGKEDREVVIFMNNPLRHGGLTFYQYQMDRASKLSVLQVVKNPGWMIPYVSCLLLTFGLGIHFAIRLIAHTQSRTKAAQETRE